MKKKRLVPALALALALLCAFNLGAHASGALQEIKAYLNSGITIKLDDEEQILKDANGTRIFPISYNDSTYLPVRAISNMLGIDVDWDQATQTVLLGSKQKGVDLIDTYKIYHLETDGDCRGWQVQTAEGKTTDISGVTHSNWIYLATGRYGGTISASYNLQGKHDTLTFSYYAGKDTTLKVTGDDGLVLGEYTITGGAVAKTITIPLYGTSELKFNGEKSWDTELYIFDTYLDAE